MNRPRPLVLAVALGVLAAIPAPAPAASGSPRVMLAGAPGQRGEAVRAWMSERLGTFGLEAGVDALRLEREEPLLGGGARVLVQQLWHGLPVSGADARVIVGPDGVLTSLVTGFERDLSAPLEPRIAPALATSLAARRAGLAAGAPAQTARLAIARRADGDHLVWEVAQRRPDGEPVRTVIDAVDGAVLDVDAGVAHAVGRVYPTDPRQPLEERELADLLGWSPLRSATFGIDDASSAPVLPSAPGDFRLMPGDSGFDQVNLYWHIEHYFHDFLGALGYPGPPNPLVVRLHFALDPEVARTSGNFVTFGNAIPGFCQEPSRSHDIVYHELGHAVLYGFGIQPGGPHREASALHEAIADYFAAAFTGDPAIGEWAYRTYPNGVTRVDQPAPPWDLAHYDLVAFGGGGLATSWANGMILSSALWDLRQRLGSTCDSLVLEALAYLPTVPTWAQFANALVAADLDHHGGREWLEVGDVMRLRGVRGGVLASIHGPAVLAPGQAGDYDALPCCGGPPGRYHWRARDWCRGVPCEAWRDVGDGDSLRTSFLGDTELELSALSPFGDPDTTRLLVRVGHPFIALQGPQRVPVRSVGTWTARVAVASPARLTWYRLWQRPGSDLEFLGHDATVSFAVQGPMDLSVTLDDAMGRSVAQSLHVDVFTDQPPAAAHEMVQVTQSLVGGAAETRVELAQAAGLRVGVYDIRGRERVLLASDRAWRGERVIRWDTGALEQGIYFVHATTSLGHSATLRFVVLR
jgi:hypothetical protein